MHRLHAATNTLARFSSRHQHHLRHRHRTTRILSTATHNSPQPSPPHFHRRSHRDLHHDSTCLRAVHTTCAVRHGYAPSEVDASTAVNVIFVDRDGDERTVLAPPGKSLLEIAHANDIDLEGACEGSLACSTCHVYLDQQTFDSLDEPCDDENDMLDLAFGLSEVSRLGCQIKVSKELDGIKVTLPPATRNMAVDGFVPQPH